MKSIPPVEFSTVVVASTRLQQKKLGKEIKTEKIMVSKNGFQKITGFGLRRRYALSNVNQSCSS